MEDNDCSRRATVRLGIYTLIANILVRFRFRFIRAPILVRALVVINLLTNTLCTILDQPPTPALRQPSTSVVNNNNRQDYAAAAQALDQLDALLAQLAYQRGKFIYIC